ncbi:MAG: hypothetical protein ACR2P8_06355 [Myxococcota bacterium]
MIDLRRFTLGDMTELGSALRRLGDGAGSMEQVATAVARHLYVRLVDSGTGGSACALVRFFKTHPYGALSPELQRFARGMLMGELPRVDVPCLTLLGTAGDEPAWNDARRSVGHRAIPLISKEMVSQAPMISSLLQQLGVEIDVLLRSDANLLDHDASSFNVFYVPEASDSAFIPAQAGFVRAHGIRSVLGFGGMLLSGDIFAVILFSKVAIPRETAELFRTLALNVKMAVLPFDELIFGLGESGAP